MINSPTLPLPGSLELCCSHYARCYICMCNLKSFCSYPQLFKKSADTSSSCSLPPPALVIASNRIHWTQAQRAKITSSINLHFANSSTIWTQEKLNYFLSQKEDGIVRLFPNGYTPIWLDWKCRNLDHESIWLLRGSFKTALSLV